MEFDPRSARRVADTTRQAEAKPRHPPAKPLGALISLPIKYARVSVQIDAATTAGPGKGKGNLVTVDYDAQGVATYGSSSVEVPLYSGAPTAIATQRIVIVALIDGRNNVIVDFCG